MSTTTAIQWTDKTWNPVRGCSIVSPGCVNCYAMKFAHRFSGEGKPYHGLTKQTKAGPQWTGVVRPVPEVIDEPLRWRKPARVFVNSMSDLFHDDVPWAFIERVFDTMREASRHTFQILTKRPENMRLFMENWTFHHGGPLANVWLGVSVEDQQRYDERIGRLLRTPAAVRFLSVEPLLGAIDMRMGGASIPDYSAHDPLPDVDWVIVGGESGPGARPCHEKWIRGIVDQCRAEHVACFVKQVGSVPIAVPYRGSYWEWKKERFGDDWRVTLNDSKGGDMDEWPIGLRVREWPATA